MKYKKHRLNIIESNFHEPDDYVQEALPDYDSVQEYSDRLSDEILEITENGEHTIVEEQEIEGKKVLTGHKKINVNAGKALENNTALFTDADGNTTELEYDSNDGRLIYRVGRGVNKWSVPNYSTLRYDYEHNLITSDNLSSGAYINYYVYGSDYCGVRDLGTEYIAYGVNGRVNIANFSSNHIAYRNTNNFYIKLFNANSVAYRNSNTSGDYITRSDLQNNTIVYKNGTYPTTATLSYQYQYAKYNGSSVSVNTLNYGDVLYRNGSSANTTNLTSNQTVLYRDGNNINTAEIYKSNFIYKNGGTLKRGSFAFSDGAYYDDNYGGIIKTDLRGIGGYFSIITSAYDSRKGYYYTTKRDLNDFSIYMTRNGEFNSLTGKIFNGSAYNTDSSELADFNTVIFDDTGSCWFDISQLASYAQVYLKASDQIYLEGGYDNSVIVTIWNPNAMIEKCECSELTWPGDSNSLKEHVYYDDSILDDTLCYCTDGNYYWSDIKGGGSGSGSGSGSGW